MNNCKRCGYSFEDKNKLIRHLKKKIICNNLLCYNIDIQTYINELVNYSKTIVKDNIKYYVCKYCKKNFKSSTGKCLHQKNCEIKHNEVNNLFNNDINDSNIINTQIINNDNSTNIGSNNNGVINNNNNNNIINLNLGNNINNTLVDDINNFITQHKLNNKMKSFPTYSIGHLFDKNFYLLKYYIDKCKKEDADPKTGHRSKFNLAVELFKDIINVNDYRTKNTFIHEITDNVAYCFLDDKFYSINVDDLFKIFFQHLHLLLKNIIKIKDTFNGMNSDDKDYVEFSYDQFREYIDKSDKIELKKELINCMYKNKKFLSELINSAKPLDELKQLESRTLQFDSSLVNKVRKNYNLSLKDIDNKDQIIKIRDKDIDYRTTNTVLVTSSEEDKIEVNYMNTEIRQTATGYNLYKTKFMNLPIWYDPDAEAGYVEFLNTHQIVPKKNLVCFIKSIVNFTHSGDIVLSIDGADNTD
jgi:hypothetical protein